MSAQEIWYITFQSPTLSGSGLATYCREVIKAAKAMNRPVRFYFVDPKATQKSETHDGLVSIVTVPGTPEPAYRDFGTFMYQSFAIAREVLADLEKGMRPIGIECPDGYALGYYLLQHKRTLHPALADIPITVVAHTPIAIIDEWIGLDPYRSPEWWLYRAEKWCFLACDTVVTYSDMLENTLRSKGYLPGHVPVARLLNPFSISDVASTSGQEPDRQPIVVMASQMLNWKGLPQAISLAQSLETARSSLNVELLGSNPTLPGKTASQIDLTRAAHPDLFTSNRLTFKGTLSHQDLVTQRNNWHCQIHPSKFDNFPYSVLECLAQGTPCLMTSGNGVSECLSADLAAALVVDFDASQDVINALGNLPSSQELREGIDWSRFDAPHYFQGRDALFNELNIQDQLPRQFPFLQDTTPSSLQNRTPPSKPNSPRVSLARDGKHTEFVSIATSAPNPEYLKAAANILDHYGNVGFVGSCSHQAETSKIRPSYNAEPMPNIMFEQTSPNTLIVRSAIWSEIGQDDPEIPEQFQTWDKVLSMLSAGHYGVILPTPIDSMAPETLAPDPDEWGQAYSQLVQKHKNLFAENVVELNGFLNANGPDTAYRLTTGDLSLYKKPEGQGRLKQPYRLARSLAKKLNRYAQKGLK